jgi:hypothetical protein
MPERNFAMIDLPDHASQLAILDQPMAKPLHDLIAGRVSNAATLGLADLTHIVVITRADDPAAVTVALGFDPLYSRLDQTIAEPDWDWLERHDEFFELVYTMANDGFAMIVFVADDGGPLAAACRA